MSFALEVKEEIMSHTFSHEQKQYFLSGFVKYNAVFIYANNQEKIKLSTISNRIARTLFAMSKEFFTGDIQIAITQSQLLKKQKTFHIILVGDVKSFIANLHIINNDDSKYPFLDRKEVKSNINMALFRAYVAGVFVATGSINSPQTTNYHLEMQFNNVEDAKYISDLLNDFDFNFKILQRNANRIICYIKKTMIISDFLKLIDAPSCVLRFENERISRDFSNSINRVNNLDISNQTKSLLAAQSQIEQITKIQSKASLSILSDKAKILAQLRLNFPEYSLVELQNEMSNKGYIISKSGVSNLFKIIKKTSEEI